MGVPGPHDVVVVVADLVCATAMVEYGTRSIGPAMTLLGDLARGAEELLA
jgi:hypothetical protein